GSARGADRLLGVEVDEVHDLGRIVCADRERGEVDPSEALADGAEAVEPAGVAGVVEAARRSLDHPSGPQAPVVSGERASGEVLRGYAVHANGAHLDALAPVELDDLAAGAAHEVAHAETGDEARAALGERGD